MGVTNRLLYDPTDAESRAAGSSIGSHVLAGDDGTPIGHKTLDSAEWLNTSSALYSGDGTTAITQTGGALDVNIASGMVDVDDSLADTAIANTATAVSLIAVNVVASALPARKWMYLANEGNRPLYFGKIGVTTANGFPLHMGQQSEFRIGASVAPQIIGAAGASAEDLRVMELS